jgi:hypothetical protein
LGDKHTSCRVNFAEDVLALGLPDVAPGVVVAHVRKVMMASRVEAKLFSPMNGVSPSKKRSTRFIHDDDVGV